MTEQTKFARKPRVTKKDLILSLHDAGREIHEIACALETRPTYVMHVLASERRPLDEDGREISGLDLMLRNRLREEKPRVLAMEEVAELKRVNLDLSVTWTHGCATLAIRDLIATIEHLRARAQQP